MMFVFLNYQTHSLGSLTFDNLLLNYCYRHIIYPGNEHKNIQKQQNKQNYREYHGTYVNVHVVNRVSVFIGI